MATVRSVQPFGRNTLMSAIAAVDGFPILNKKWVSNDIERVKNQLSAFGT